MKAETTVNRTPDQLIAEVRIVKTALRWPEERWRWDITWQRAVEGVNGGVYDARVHLAGNFGYTHTRWGAWRAIRRAYTRRVKP